MDEALTKTQHHQIRSIVNKEKNMRMKFKLLFSFIVGSFGFFIVEGALADPEQVMACVNSKEDTYLSLTERFTSDQYETTADQHNDLIQGCQRSWGNLEESISAPNGRKFVGTPSFEITGSRAIHKCSYNVEKTSDTMIKLKLRCEPHDCPTIGSKLIRGRVITHTSPVAVPRVKQNEYMASCMQEHMGGN